MDHKNIDKFQFEVELQLNQTGQFYFQQHLFTTLVAEYNYTMEGADYDTVERASIADGAGSEALGLCSAFAAKGPKESTTLPGMGNCNLEGKIGQGKIEWSLINKCRLHASFGLDDKIVHHVIDHVCSIRV